MKTRIAVLGLFVGLLLAAAAQAQASCRIDVIAASVRRVVNTDDRIVTVYRTRTGAGMRQVNCPDQAKPSVRLWSEDREEWVWFDEKVDRDGFVFRKNALAPGIYKIVLWTSQFNGRNEAGQRLTRYITGERRFRAN
jgi:hypothetical protein